MNSPINPKHYDKYAIQPIDFITKNGLGFLEGNVIKYVVRYKDKNGLEDLLKAKSYLDRLIKEVEEDNGVPYVATTIYRDKDGNITKTETMKGTFNGA